MFHIYSHKLIFHCSHSQSPDILSGTGIAFSDLSWAECIRCSSCTTHTHCSTADSLSRIGSNSSTSCCRRKRWINSCSAKCIESSLHQKRTECTIRGTSSSHYHSSVLEASRSHHCTRRCASHSCWLIFKQHTAPSPSNHYQSTERSMAGRLYYCCWFGL